MKISWNPDKGISWKNRLFWYAIRPAFWWVDFCSKISGNGQKYSIKMRIGD